MLNGPCHGWIRCRASLSNRIPRPFWMPIATSLCCLLETAVGLRPTVSETGKCHRFVPSPESPVFHCQPLAVYSYFSALHNHFASFPSGRITPLGDMSVFFSWCPGVLPHSIDCVSPSLEQSHLLSSLLCWASATMFTLWCVGHAVLRRVLQSAQLLVALCPEGVE